MCRFFEKGLLRNMCSDLAIQSCENKSFKVAWYSTNCNKVMMQKYEKNSDVGLLTKENAVWVYPIGETRKSKEIFNNKIRKRGLRISNKVCIPRSVVEFYAKQKVISVHDLKVIVVDVHDDFTDVSILNNINKDWSICEYQRIECGKRDIEVQLQELVEVRFYNRTKYTVENIEKEEDRIGTLRLPIKKNYNIEEKEIIEVTAFLNFKVASCIRRYQHIYKISNGKIFLSGEIFNSQLLVDTLRKLMPEFKIYSYKPADVAILGGAYYAIKYNFDEKM